MNTKGAAPRGSGGHSGLLARMRFNTKWWDTGEVPGPRHTGKLRPRHYTLRQRSPRHIVVGRQETEQFHCNGLPSMYIT